MISTEVAGRKQIQAANQTFASMKAAHETAMALQAETEYRALPDKLQAEQERRGFDTLTSAKSAGFLPVATVALDQGPAQNTANAMTALNNVKSQFGAVPASLLYVHTGNGVTVLKLQDPNASLDTINQVRRAQGMQPLGADTFGAMSSQDKEAMAREAINFANPSDASGVITQNSLNLTNMRLLTVKAQPAFSGQDALISQLQASADHQKAVLDSGAGQEAIRKGQATGAEAQAAQPGQTAAEVAKINATAGPEAKAAGAKAGAEEAAKLPYELQLKQAEMAQNPVFAVNPKTGQRELTTMADAKEQGFTNSIKASQSDVEKAGEFNAQANDVQMNTSRYKAAINAVQTPFSKIDTANATMILADPQVNNFLLNEAGLPAVMSQITQGDKAKAFNALSPDKQQAVIGYLRMKGAAIAYQKMLTNQGRTSKEGLDIELANIPSPILGATVANKQLEAFQENIDTAAQRSVKLPWMESPRDVRARIEGQATQQYNQTQAAKPQGKYRASGTVSIGQNVQIPNTAGLSRVRRVYNDGTFDADQHPQ
jgi:hypothetical protein